MRSLVVLSVIVGLALAGAVEYASCDCPAGTVFSLAPTRLCADGVSSAGPLRSCWYRDGTCVPRWSVCPEDCAADSTLCPGSPNMYFTCTQCQTSDDCVPIDFCGYNADLHTCTYMTMSECPAVACSVTSCGAPPPLAARVCCDDTTRSASLTCEANNNGGCSWFIGDAKPCPEDTPCAESDCPSTANMGVPESFACPDGSSVAGKYVCDRSADGCTCAIHTVPSADCPTSVVCTGADACANAPFPSFAAFLCWDGSTVSPTLGDCVPAADGTMCIYEILPAPDCPPLPLCGTGDCAGQATPSAFASLPADCIHTDFYSEPKCVRSLDGNSCHWVDACAEFPCCREPVPGGCDCSDQSHVETSTPGCQWTCILNALENTCAWSEVCTDLCQCADAVAIACPDGESTVAGAAAQCLQYADGSCSLAVPPCPTSCCGPAPGMASILCPDGSVGGFTGKCLESCSWEIRECPSGTPTDPNTEPCQKADSVRGEDGICRIASSYILKVSANANNECPTAATLSASVSAELSSRCSECHVTVFGVEPCEYRIVVLHPETSNTDAAAKDATAAVAQQQDPTGDGAQLLSISPANPASVLVAAVGLLVVLVAALL